MRIARVLFAVSLAVAATARAAADSSNITAARQDDSVVIKAGGKEVMRYQLQKPADVKLPVDSGCYFHPLRTPAGVVVTDVAPPDHAHHRGVFLAWVEMHGAKDADFWGWGEHAPIKDRRIINREVSEVGSSANSDARDSTAAAGFRARNDWVTEGETIVREDLKATVRARGDANVLDLIYTLTPTADLTLSRWAFSGFCVRTLGPAAAPQITAYGPDAPVDLPNPSHVKPESDWPAAPWYGYTLKLKDGNTAGVAVIDHPQNPPSLWHNHRDVRMLNPCIVAPDKVVLKKGQPLVLRYRVVTHDGETPRFLIKALAREFRGDE